MQQAADKSAAVAGKPAVRAVQQATDIRAEQAELQVPEQVQVLVQLQLRELLPREPVPEQGQTELPELIWVRRN